MDPAGPLTGPSPPSGPVLLTGATGFVGSHVAAALVGAGVRVRALVRPGRSIGLLEAAGVEPVTGTLEDEESLRSAVRGSAAVVHLAALTRARTEEEYDRTNRAGTALLLRAALETESPPRRFVYLSSLAAVGPAEGGRPVRPADTPRPLTAYGRSKLAGELVLAGTGGIQTMVVRAPAVYGPRDRDLYGFFRLAARGVLPVPTGPDRPLQLVHVEDLSAAIVCAAIGSSASGTVHVAEERAYPWIDVARMVAGAVGRRARIVRVPASLISGGAAVSEWLAGLAGRATVFNRDKARELLAPGWLCETETAREKLGFVARVPLKDGLERTAEWYRNEGWL